MWQDLSSKCFKELEGLVGHMWPSVFLQKHNPFRELASTLVLDGLFELHQRVGIHRQFNSDFTCGYPTILPYEPIYSRNRCTVDHNVLLPRAWQVLDVYASGLITLTPPEYGAPCDTLLSVHRFLPTIKFWEACSLSARRN